MMMPPLEVCRMLGNSVENVRRAIRFPSHVLVITLVCLIPAFSLKGPYDLGIWTQKPARRLRILATIVFRDESVFGYAIVPEFVFSGSGHNVSPRSGPPSGLFRHDVAAYGPRRRTGI